MSLRGPTEGLPDGVEPRDLSAALRDYERLRQPEVLACALRRLLDTPAKRTLLPVVARALHPAQQQRFLHAFRTGEPLAREEAMQPSSFRHSAAAAARSSPSDTLAWVDRHGRSTSPPPDGSDVIEALKNQIRQVHLSASLSQSLGLMIRGGREHGLGIFVTAIDSGSAAHASGLMVGDQVLEVNGLRCAGMTHSEAVNALKSNARLTLTVRNVGKIPFARTTYARTPERRQHRTRDVMYELPKQRSSPFPEAAEVPFSRGIGSQLVHTATQPRLTGVSGDNAALPAQTGRLLNEREQRALRIYLRQYSNGDIQLAQLLQLLVELFDTNAKFTLMNDIRCYISPRDIDQYDEFIVRREINAISMEEGDAMDPLLAAINEIDDNEFASMRGNTSRQSLDDIKSGSDDSGVELHLLNQGRSLYDANTSLTSTSYQQLDDLLPYASSKSLASHRLTTPSPPTSPKLHGSSYVVPLNAAVRHRDLPSSMSVLTRVTDDYVRARAGTTTTTTTTTTSAAAAGWENGNERTETLEIGGTVCEIIIPKTRPTLGLAIEGGNLKHLPLPRVVCIQVGGAGEQSFLKENDLLLEVDSVPLRGKSHDECARILSDAFRSDQQSTVELLVLRQLELEESVRL